MPTHTRVRDTRWGEAMTETVNECFDTQSNVAAVIQSCEKGTNWKVIQKMPLWWIPSDRKEEHGPGILSKLHLPIVNY